MSIFIVISFFHQVDFDMQCFACTDASILKSVVGNFFSPRLYYSLDIFSQNFVHFYRFNKKFMIKT